MDPQEQPPASFLAMVIRVSASHEQQPKNWERDKKGTSLRARVFCGQPSNSEEKAENGKLP